MRPLDAYQRQKHGALPRVDLILALFRKALELLDRTDQALQSGQNESARHELAKVQLIVTSLSSGHAGANDDVSLNFLRLYEFVAHKLALGGPVDIDAAKTVLRNLFEAFAAVRDQAAALEAQAQIPPLEREHQVQLSA